MQTLCKELHTSFSEYGHVGYQIEGNDACSYMVSIILPVDTSSARWSKVKEFFSEISHVAYQMK